MTEITAHVTARRMSTAAQALLEALTPEQRGRANLPLGDEAERRRWSYYPREFHGLPLLEMTGSQEKLIGNLLESGLSLSAHAKVATIMGLENVLDRLEHHARGDRNPGRYFVSIFGTPGSFEPWGWRFEGHHVSLHFTIAGEDLLGVAPSFLGANPARTTHGGHTVTRPLAEEEDVARELFLSLDSEQREKTLLSSAVPIDFVLTNAPRVPKRQLPGEGIQTDFPEANRVLFDRLTVEEKERLAFDSERPAGISGEELSDDQRDMLFNLVRVYLDRLPDDAAGQAIVELGEDVVAGLHFAWAGESEPRKPHYYRIQGPRLLVEYDNTQNNTNHVHSVWRDPVNDFGEDLLRRHLAEAPHSTPAR
jgi:hypothetical protein